jgi:hypothetical protein
MVYIIAVSSCIPAPHHWSVVNWILYPNAFIVYNIAIMSYMPTPNYYWSVLNWILYPDTIMVCNMAIICHILAPDHWSALNWVLHPSTTMVNNISIMCYIAAPYDWSIMIYYIGTFIVNICFVLAYHHCNSHQCSVILYHVSFCIIINAFRTYTLYHWYVLISYISMFIMILRVISQLLSYLLQYRTVSLIIGGHRTCIIKYEDIYACINSNASQKFLDIKTKGCCFIDYVHINNTNQYNADYYLQVKFPMHELVQFVPIARARQLASMHGVEVGLRTTVAQLKIMLKDHMTCNVCDSHITIVAVHTSYKKNNSDASQRKQLLQQQTLQRVAKYHSKKTNLDFDICDLASIFPPQPVDKKLSIKIIDASCSKMKPETFEEKGCAICGQLIHITSLSKISAVKNYLHILEAPGYTRQERLKSSDKICEFPLAIDYSCQQICNVCRSALRSGKVPKLALARGLWLGQVPKVLSDLRYVEKMLVARIRHSFCSV